MVGIDPRSSDCEYPWLRSRLQRRHPSCSKSRTSAVKNVAQHRSELARFARSGKVVDRVFLLSKEKMVALARDAGSGYALEINGRHNTEFATRDGAKSGVRELKKRFLMLRVRIYDAQANTREDVA